MSQRVKDEWRKKKLFKAVEEKKKSEGNVYLWPLMSWTETDTFILTAHNKIFKVK